MLGVGGVGTAVAGARCHATGRLLRRDWRLKLNKYLYFEIRKSFNFYYIFPLDSPELYAECPSSRRRRRRPVCQYLLALLGAPASGAAAEERPGTRTLSPPRPNRPSRCSPRTGRTNRHCRRRREPDGQEKPGLPFSFCFGEKNGYGEIFWQIFR